MSAVNLNFGKYKGRPISSVPSDYLVWMLENFDNSYWLEKALEQLITSHTVEVTSGMVVNGEPTTIIKVRNADGSKRVVKSAFFPSPKPGVPMPVEDIVSSALPAVFMEPAPGNPWGVPVSLQDMLAVDQYAPTPEEYNSSPFAVGEAGTLLKRVGKRSKSISITDTAFGQIQVLYSSDLKALHSDVVQAASLLVLEVAIYGSEGGEQWVPGSRTVELEWVYLQARWTFLLSPDYPPQLAYVVEMCS